MKWVTVLLSVLFLAGCGDGKADAVKQLAAEADSLSRHTGQVVDLAKFDMPLLFNSPGLQSTGGAEPNLVWKEDVGKLEIKAGEHFGINITEQPDDMERLKADLDRDLLKKNTVIKEVPGLLVFKSEFPDDPSLVYIHFHEVLSVGGRSFTVDDIDAGLRFNEQDIEQMAASVTTKQPI